MGISGKVIAVRQPSFYGKLRKPQDIDVRSREHLTPAEVESLIKAAKEAGRHGHRDATLILVAYRHGLRVSEAVALRWNQVELDQGRPHVHPAQRRHTVHAPAERP